MNVYAMVVGDTASQDDFSKMGAHFEKKGDAFEAGRAYLKSGEFKKVHTFSLYMFSFHLKCVNVGCGVFAAQQ